MDTLTVVNEMLGTMGETSLSSLTDYHPFLADCLDTLNRVSQNVQAKPWWFNEEKATLTPNVVDSFIYLPNDLLEIMSCKAEYVQRGGRLYNTETGSYVFTDDVTMTIRRLLDFEDLPQIPASYIAAEAVLQFQSSYDGDSNKRAEKAAWRDNCLVNLNAEETRKRKINLLENNPRLYRIKRATQRLRGWTG